MRRLTQDGTVEPVALDQILRRERGQGKFLLFAQLTTTRFATLPEESCGKAHITDLNSTSSVTNPYVKTNTPSASCWSRSPKSGNYHTSDLTWKAKKR